jgi:myo-inositol-1(or 4)-monophosphatase
MVAYDNQFQKHKAMLKNLPLLQEKCFTLRIFGSATVDICKVSEGAIEARVFHKTKFVDFAAGAVIVKEAGGNITDFDGRRVTAKTSDVIASNGWIHKELVDLLVLD